jgi:hypothetical protein
VITRHVRKPAAGRSLIGRGETGKRPVCPRVSGSEKPETFPSVPVFITEQLPDARHNEQKADCRDTQQDAQGDLGLLPGVEVSNPERRQYNASNSN